MFVPLARSRGHHGQGLDDRRALLPATVFVESVAADWIAEKSRPGDGRGREDDGRRRLVSVRRGRRSVQEIYVLVELRVVRYRGGGGGGRYDGPFDAPDERIDQERPGHGLLGGTGCHRSDGRRARCAVHFRWDRDKTKRRTTRGTLSVRARARTRRRPALRSSTRVCGEATDSLPDARPRGISRGARGSSPPRPHGGRRLLVSCAATTLIRRGSASRVPETRPFTAVVVVVVCVVVVVVVVRF